MLIKRIFVLFLCGILSTQLIGCSSSKDDIIESIGESSKISYYSDNGFQDHTDYAKYNITDVNLKNNKYFQQINEQLKSDFEKHLNDFENRINSNDEENEIVKNYDFNKSLVSDNDYIYIYDNPDYQELGYYSVYYFDFESNILYYFHNNT